MKANERKKTLKWILSTNPAQTLDNLKKLYPQEVFLNKLIQIIQKEDFVKIRYQINFNLGFNQLLKYIRQAKKTIKRIKLYPLKTFKNQL